MIPYWHNQVSCCEYPRAQQLASWWLLMPYMALLLVFVLVPASAQAQKSATSVINFQDLQRPGRETIKVYPLTGLKQEADRWFSSFSDIDASERSEIASAMANSSSGGSGGGSIKFTCTVECRGSWWANSGRLEVEVLASSSEQAIRHLEDKKHCKGSRGEDVFGSSTSTSYAAIFCNQKY